MTTELLILWYIYKWIIERQELYRENISKPQFFQGSAPDKVF